MTPYAYPPGFSLGSAGYLLIEFIPSEDPPLSVGDRYIPVRLKKRNRHHDRGRSRQS